MKMGKFERGLREGNGYFYYIFSPVSGILKCSAGSLTSDHVYLSAAFGILLFLWDVSIPDALRAQTACSSTEYVCLR